MLRKIDSGDNLFLQIYDNIDSIYVLAPKNLQTIKIVKGDQLVVSNLVFEKNYTDKFSSRNFEYLLIAKSVLNMSDFTSEDNSETKEHVHTADEPPHEEPTQKAVAVDPSKNPHGTATTTETNPDVNTAKIEGGYTVAELYSRVDELVGKEVKIRAKVVKYSPNIMNQNWLHIQDGSGNQSDSTNDLVVVSKEPFNKGETVVIKGKLGKDHNLGSGYLYHVIILDAKKIK